eukprot:gene1143-2663_t
MGAGLEVGVGDVAFKSNFATWVPETGVVASRRADRNFEGLGPELCRALDGAVLPDYPEHSVSVKYATEHRCGVRLRGPNLSDQITGTDPLKDNLPLRECRPLTERDSDARLTSKLVNAVSTAFHQLLVDHPINIDRVKQGKKSANIVLLRGAGIRIQVPEFQTLHQMKGFVIAPTCIIAGLAESLGLDVIVAPGATGDYHSNFMSKAETLCKTFKQSPEYEFAFLHIKAVDDTGHDGSLAMKAQYLEKIDDMLGSLLELLTSQTQDSTGHPGFLLALTGDHSTPCVTKDHCYEPVPFALAPVPLEEQSVQSGAQDSSQCMRDNVTTYSEVSAPRGYLGRFCGSE